MPTRGEHLFGSMGQMPGSRMIGAARAVRVSLDPASGAPVAVSGAPVAAVRDEWLIDEGWWTGSRTMRRYLDLVLADGRNEVVYHDIRSGTWWSQRA
jgi:hypothetical protein